MTVSFNFIFPAKKELEKGIKVCNMTLCLSYCDLSLTRLSLMPEVTIFVCSGKRIVFCQFSDDGGNVACTSPYAHFQIFVPVSCGNAIIVTRMKETFCSDAQTVFEDHFEIVLIPLVIHIPQNENSHLRYFHYDYMAVHTLSYIFCFILFLTYFVLLSVLTFCLFVQQLHATLEEDSFQAINNYLFCPHHPGSIHCFLTVHRSNTALNAKLPNRYYIIFGAII